MSTKQTRTFNDCSWKEIVNEKDIVEVVKKEKLIVNEKENIFTEKNAHSTDVQGKVKMIEKTKIEKLQDENEDDDDEKKDTHDCSHYDDH